MNCNKKESNKGSPKGSLNKETGFPKNKKKNPNLYLFT